MKKTINCSYTKSTNAVDPSNFNISRHLALGFFKGTDYSDNKFFIKALFKTKTGITFQERLAFIPLNGKFSLEKKGEPNILNSRHSKISSNDQASVELALTNAGKDVLFQFLTLEDDNSERYKFLPNYKILLKNDFFQCNQTSQLFVSYLKNPGLFEYLRYQFSKIKNHCSPQIIKIIFYEK